MKTIISASMLASDLANIEKEIHRTENAQVEWLHIDVMDGVFVDNITYGTDGNGPYKAYSAVCKSRQ